LPGALRRRLLPDFAAEAFPDSGSDVPQRVGTVSPGAPGRQGGGHHRSRERIPGLRNLHGKGPRRDRVDLRRTPGTGANPAGEPAVLDFEQPRIGHLVQVEGREPWLDPGMPRGLLAAHRFFARAQIQVKLLASRLSQQGNRH